MDLRRRQVSLPHAETRQKLDELVSRSRQSQRPREVDPRLDRVQQTLVIPLVRAVLDQVLDGFQYQLPRGVYDLAKVAARLIHLNLVLIDLVVLDAQLYVLFVSDLLKRLGEVNDALG